MSVTVTLTPGEILGASYGGFRRQCFAETRALKDKIKTSDAWRIHIEGARCEKAVAVFLGLDWPANIGRIGAPDLIYRNYEIEVRSTREAANTHLIIYSADPDLRIAVFVRGWFDTFELMGWMQVGEAKHPRYQHDGQWWVPQADLHDIAILKSLNNERAA